MCNSAVEFPGSSKCWLSPDGKPIDDNQLLELWKQQNLNQVAYLDLHFKYANWYSALFLALTTAYIIGFSQYYTNIASILFLALPVLIIILAHFGKKAVDRFYVSFLETVTILAKLEDVLGMAGAVTKKPYVESKPVLWPEDKQFIPSRHFEARYNYVIKSSHQFICVHMKLGASKTTHIKSSDQFIDEHMKLGASKTTHYTFLTFQIVSLLLLIGGIIIYVLFRMY